MTSGPLTPAVWERVKELFLATLEVERAEREAFLDRQCADDAIRREVAALLASHDAMEGTPDTPPDTPPETGPAERVSAFDPLVGTVLGAYRLDGVIGRGGMGTVYRAVRADDAFLKHVAIKVVKRGMDTDFVLQRFRAERQILARLDHPGIARLFDGGSTGDGRPYVVMELVEGMPLDRWADSRQLDLRGRLELFLKVCGAVQYAHQNLVVHRDLKPGNILVTPEGEPKLLDFGIAKVLDPEMAAESTATLARLMTPEYASPEQIRGDPVTTVTDVHGLGIVLYELLTGRRPYRVAGRDPNEVARVVCEEEPARPSAAVGGTRLGKALAGDLDMILLMALSKDPARRYASVEQLADDIRRHIGGLPVRARKSTAFYRAGRFLLRNRVPAAATLAIALALAAGFLAAHNARVRAERRFREVRGLANALLFPLHDAVAPLPGSTRARQLLVKEALTYLDNLSKEVEGDPALQRDVAAAYGRLAEIQGVPGDANLGDAEGALASCRRALALYEVLVSEEPDDADAHAGLAENHRRVARLQMRQGDTRMGFESFRLARREGEVAVALAPDNVDYQVTLAQIDRSRAMALVVNSQGDAAGRTALEESIARATEAVRRAPGHVAARSLLARARQDLAWVLVEHAEFAAAEKEEAAAQALCEALAAEDPLSTAHQRGLARVYYNTGGMMMRMGRWREAVAVLKLSVAKGRSLIQADPADFHSGRQMVDSLGMFCTALLAGGRRAEALDACRESETRAQALALSAPGSYDGYSAAGAAQQTNAELWLRLGRPKAALASMRGALSTYEAFHTAHPEHAEAQQFVAFVRMRLADLLDRQGAWDEALRLYGAAAAELASFSSPADPDAGLLVQACHISSRMGSLHERMAAAGGPAAQAAHWRQAQEAYGAAVESGQRLRTVSPQLFARGPAARETEAARQGLIRCRAALAAPARGARRASTT